MDRTAALLVHCFPPPRENMEFIVAGAAEAPIGSKGSNSLASPPVPLCGRLQLRSSSPPNTVAPAPFMLVSKPSQNVLEFATEQPQSQKLLRARRNFLRSSLMRIHGSALIASAAQCEQGLPTIPRARADCQRTLIHPPSRAQGQNHRPQFQLFGFTLDRLAPARGPSPQPR